MVIFPIFNTAFLENGSLKSSHTSGCDRRTRLLNIANRFPLALKCCSSLNFKGDVKARLNQDCRLAAVDEVPPAHLSPGAIVSVPRRMVNLVQQSISRTLTPTRLAKPSTPSPHFNKSALCLVVPKNCDSWNGYPAAPLHPEDRHLTSVITPWDRYRYRVAPQGYVASGDG